MPEHLRGFTTRCYINSRYFYLLTNSAERPHVLLVLLTGDGGNDVSMIQAADVGVGIIGKVCV